MEATQVCDFPSNDIFYKDLGSVNGPLNWFSGPQRHFHNLRVHQAKKVKNLLLYSIGPCSRKNTPFFVLTSQSGCIQSLADSTPSSIVDL